MPSDPLTPEVIGQLCEVGGLGRPVRVTRRTGGELSGVFEVAPAGSDDPVIVKVYAAQWAWTVEGDLRLRAAGTGGRLGDAEGPRQLRR